MNRVTMLAAAISIFGSVSIAARIFGIAWVYTSPWGGVTMKVPTALGFVITGAIIYCLYRLRTGQSKNPRALSFLAMALLGLMVWILSGIALQIPLAAIFRERNPAPMTFPPSYPSAGTCIAFILLAFAATVEALRPKAICGRALIVSGFLIACLGAIAVAGYAVGVPEMYFCSPGRSTGMAFQTAVGFLAVGSSLMLLSATPPHRYNLA